MKLNRFNQILNESSEFNINNRANEIDAKDYLFQPVKKPSRNLLKLSYTFSAVLVIFLFSFYLYFTQTTFTTVTIDINPSIEVDLNRFNRVIDIKPLNDDAQAFIDSLDKRRMPFDQFIDGLYQAALDGQYFTPSNAEALVGVYGKSYQTESDVLQIITQKQAIDSVAVTFHSEDNTTFFTLPETENTYFLSSINYLVGASSDTTSSAIYGSDVETPGTSEDSSDSNIIRQENATYSEADWEAVANHFDISITKLNIIRYIFVHSEDYTTETDLTTLVQMNITDLNQLYRQLLS